MSDPQANGQLELACRVGSIDAIDEALEEGADLDFDGGSPLFIGIMAGDRAVVEALVERGADASIFGIVSDDGDRGKVVEALMKLAPSTEAPPEADPVDAKLVRAFDRMIRGKGLGEPLRRNRGGEFTAFADGLKWIAAEESHACVAEFLEMIETVRAESGDAGLPRFLEENEARVAEIGARYLASDEQIGELLKEYRRERRKLEE